MRTDTHRRRLVVAFALIPVLFGCATTPAGAQSRQQRSGSGFNLFSAEQDVELGRQAARQVEQQLPMLRHARVNGYVEELVRRLARQAEGPRFPYQVKVVNASDINAFALPGGFLYVNRGLLEAVRNEGELAGVVAHEIAHVALRHGTKQATKGAAAQTGLELLTQILGRNDRKAGQIAGVVGGLGLNAAFLHFSRDAEREADQAGARMMARAGYDPMAMASFFELLAQQRRSNPSKVANFFSSHPAPGDRAALIRQAGYEREYRPNSQVGDIRLIRQDLQRLPPAPGPRRTSR
jgi:beta-barrel assembly-enhancing protease